MTYKLELLHFADQEAGSAAVADAPNMSAVLNALQQQDLGDDGVADNTIILSSGDAFIPGLFFDASTNAFGSAGIADIQIQNELGVQAIALGNHEFDFGTQTLADLISGSATGDFSSLSGTALDGLDFTGTDFPYLSANLDFLTDANMAPLETAGGQTPQGNVVTSSTVITQGADGGDLEGELIGVVGATTPTLGSISSPDDIGISPNWVGGNPTDAELDALAAEIQTEVDALLAANPNMNKVILLAHMQQIDIELALAERLEGVDVIVAGGSNTRLFDSNDRPRDGDSDQGDYPQFVENAGGTTTAVVNTDGSYKYAGRLVIEFDEDGNIIEDSYDEDVSGAYATDDQGVADLDAGSLIDPEIQAIADAIEAEIIATESNVFGYSDVFLNGNRSGTGAADDTDGVRTQETNLGNLTADANLDYAKDFDDSVVVSIKNGGGIRASIGETIVPAGGTEAVRGPNSEVVDGDGNVIKAEGGISQNDIQTTLAFNNGLTLLTLTRAELIEVLEHGVSALPGVAGAFPQISGVEFSYDETQPAGSRIVDAEIVDADGNIIDTLMANGALVGDGSETIRIVTLTFLADGGDDYPFPTGTEADRLDLTDLDSNGEDDDAQTGVATFADDGTEQDALAEYLSENFGDPANAFSLEDQDAANDSRIDAIFDGSLTGEDDAEALVGSSSADIIRAGGGDDTLSGGAGSDQTWGGDGNDSVNAGSGDDTLGGGAGDDSLGAGDGDDVAYTGEGADQVFGSTGSDQVFGGNGDDLLFGGNGDDTIFGGSGDDTIWGGAGNDKLYGGAGDVIYGFAAGFGNDQVFGFTTAGDNTLNLSQLGLTDVNDLSFTQQGADLLIDTGAGTITLVSTTEADIDASDFLF